MRGGGIVTFNCGPSPVTIELTSTLTTCNTHNCTHPWQGGAVNNKLVIDGGGGGAVRLTHQTATSYIVNSTLEGNSCANGGAISGLHASIHLINSMVTGNTATCSGANSGQAGRARCRSATR